MPRPLGDTRERLLDAAEGLFHAHGFAGVAVEDVTSSLGFTKPSLYSHFRDKNELYAAARARRLARQGAALERALGVDAPFPDVLQAVFAVLLRQPQFLSALTQRDAETFLPPIARDALFAHAYGVVYEPLAGLFQRAIAAEEWALPPALVPFAFETLVALVTHFAARPMADAALLEPAAARLAAVFMKGTEGLEGNARRTANQIQFANGHP